MAFSECFVMFWRDAELLHAYCLRPKRVETVLIMKKWQWIIKL